MASPLSLVGDAAALRGGMAMKESASRLTQCPGCGSKGLIPVRAGEQMNFYCGICVLCWFLENGVANIVDPQTCAGCELGRTACLGGIGPLHSRW